jgi:hypothetical protein
MTEWVNYGIDGKRVPSDSERAVFRAKEVSVDIGVPARPGHASLAGVEYREVHATARPAQDLQVILQDAGMVRRASGRRKGPDSVTWIRIGDQTLD